MKNGRSRSRRGEETKKSTEEEERQRSAKTGQLV